FLLLVLRFGLLTRVYLLLGLFLLWRLVLFLLFLFFLLDPLDPERNHSARFVEAQIRIALCRLGEILHLPLRRQCAQQALDRGVVGFLGLARFEELPFGRLALLAQLYDFPLAGPQVNGIYL